MLQDWGLLAEGWAIRDEIEAKEYEAEICAMRSRAISIRPREVLQPGQRIWSWCTYYKIEDQAYEVEIHVMRSRLMSMRSRYIERNLYLLQIA